MGRPDRDTTLYRVHLISDQYTTYGNSNTCVVLGYDPGKVNLLSLTTRTMSNSAYFDVGDTARWFDVTITSPPAAGTMSIARIACEMQVTKGTEDGAKHFMVG
jgi:hypothetical protein